MPEMIPYGRQEIAQQDIDAVVEVLRSDFLTQGPAVPRFEQAVATYCHAAHAIAVNSATSALHIACMALDLGPGDWLWTSPNTFVASANCARYCNANVDFVDIESRTYNMSVERLEEKLHTAEREGRLPKIVVPVHFAGQSCDMATIHSLSQRFGFRIIEDASHAIGGKYKSEPVGNCHYSDITVFSFHPVKIITTAEGGMAMTNDPQLAERMQRLRTHGITNKPDLTYERPVEEIWNYQQIDLGYNYRMTDLQAALGTSQMSRLNEFVGRRHEIAQRYDVELADLPLTTPWQSPATYSSYHLYPIRVRANEGGKTQKRIYKTLWENGVAANLHYIPVHRHPYYENLGLKEGNFPEAEQYHREVISLPMFATLTLEQQEHVIYTLRKELAL